MGRAGGGRRRRTHRAALLAVGLVLTACGTVGQTTGQAPAGAGSAPLAPTPTPRATPTPDPTLTQAPRVLADLEIAREATEAYQDIQVARADGYVLDFGCQNWVGSHWVNKQLIDDPEIDLRSPEVLMYDGSLELVGIEYMAYTKDTTRPDLLGSPMDGPTIIPQSAVASQLFWWRHVWLYRDSPNGLFSELNPSVRC